MYSVDLLTYRLVDLFHMFHKELKNTYPEAIKFLVNAINKNKLANSYAFIGNEKDDILRFSLNIAEILNCSNNSSSTPCGSCINCKWLSKNEHPHAFLSIKPELTSKKGQIKVEIIRELLNKLQITSDFFRVICFEEANINTLTPECCNLLLKTIEESHKNVLFIFSASSKDDILPTILSRSQIIYLNKRKDNFSPQTNNELFQNILNAETFTASLKERVEKAKEIKNYLTENILELKDFLSSLAFTYYDSMKFSNPKRYSHIFANISDAYLKEKSFMQSSIVLEDLFIVCE